MSEWMLCGRWPLGVTHITGIDSCKVESYFALIILQEFPNGFLGQCLACGVELYRSSLVPFFFDELEDAVVPVSLHQYVTIDHTKML